MHVSQGFKIIFSAWVFMMLSLMYGCEPAWEDPYETFTIPKGKHYSTYRVELMQSEVLDFQAKFDHTVEYQTQTEENQYDINKLFGFSDCNSHHQEHSARFGWRWVSDSVEIFAYSYVDGERISELMGRTVPYQEDNYLLSLTQDAYVYQFNDHVFEIPRKHACDQGVYYLLFPYFGGDETAPHDIHVYINRAL
jgi:hypothetical protein